MFKDNIKELISKDLFNILIIYVASIIIFTIFMVLKGVVLDFLPILQNTNIFLIYSFILTFAYVLVVGVSIVIFIAWQVFQLVVISLFLVVFFVAIFYYGVYLILNALKINIKRTKWQNIGKIIAFYMGFIIALLYIFGNYPIGNLFNFNIITILIFNFEDYLMWFFQFAFELITYSLFFAYSMIFINDISFVIFRKIVKKKIRYKKELVGYEYTSKEEKEIEKKISNALGITERSTISKSLALFFIVIILLFSFISLKISLSRNTTINYKFSKNFVFLGDNTQYINDGGLRNIYSYGYLTGIGMWTMPLTNIEFGIVGLDKFQEIYEKPFSQFWENAFSFSWQWKMMFLDFYTLDGLEFTMQLQNGQYYYATMLSFLYKHNETYELAKGFAILPDYFTSSFPYSYDVDIYGLYIYSAFQLGTPNATYYGLPLVQIRPVFNLFQFLFYW